MREKEQIARAGYDGGNCPSLFPLFLRGAAKQSGNENWKIDARFTAKLDSSFTEEKCRLTNPCWTTQDRGPPDMRGPYPPISEGEGGHWKEDVVREVAWILYYKSVLNADEGGRRSKNPKFFWTSNLEDPEGRGMVQATSDRSKACKKRVPPHWRDVTHCLYTAPFAC